MGKLHVKVSDPELGSFDDLATEGYGHAVEHIDLPREADLKVSRQGSQQ